MAVSSFMVPLRSPVPDFALESVEGTTIRRDDFADAPALLVMFLSNHCPYVRHLEAALGKLLAGYPQLGVVGICSNDTENYPEDAPQHMREQRARANWNFPYLFDPTQQVAKDFRAACTPDFFLYDRAGTLAYRGAFDESTPGNRNPVTGHLLRDAIEAVLAGQPVPEPHRPSLGCSIKWRPGNEPE
ncbi:MAG TPA: thioredoxin family protein [Micromonosporaceae bacterium]